MTTGVFINYGGEDSHSYEALLYNELKGQFGEDQIFLDAEPIRAGADLELGTRPVEAGNESRCPGSGLLVHRSASTPERPACEWRSSRHVGHLITRRRTAVAIAMRTPVVSAPPASVLI